MSSTLIQASFSLSTWLAVGACLQSILFLLLPSRVALLPALILLLSRFIHGALITKGFMRNPYLPSSSNMRKVTAPIMNEDGLVFGDAINKGLVVFLVGAEANHPLGIFAPGFKEIGDRFAKMWIDAAANREKWGYLGKTSGMPRSTPGGGTSLVTISYWKSMEHLHAFAQGPTHREGWDWFNQIHKAHPHIGIFHETHAVAAGGWENIYNSMWPLGMGEIKYPMKDKDGGTTHEMSSLMDASKGRWKTMLSRMAQKEIV